MRFGLAEKTIDKINTVFSGHPAIEKAVLYGSRAKGNYRPGSDIDLTLYGDALASSELDEIITELDELLLPYHVDLSIFDAIDHAKLREHIDRMGVVFYQRADVGEDQGLTVKAGWQIKTLGELCNIVGGGTPPKDKPAYYSGEIPWATVRDMRQDVITETEFRITKDAVQSSSTNIIPSGNVVIATRVGLGKVCLLGQDTAINQDLRGVIPRDKKTLAVGFLYWWLKSIADAIVAEGTGATVQGVKLPFVKSLRFPLPPLPEQHRIVAILDEAFAGIATARANAEQNRQNARALFESHLQSVFTARGEGWVEKPLGEIGKVCMCKRILKEQTTSKGDIPFYKIGTFGKEADAFIPIEIYSEFRKKYSFPNKGDVLISAAGTIGRRVVYDGEVGYFQDSNIVWIANDQTQILNHYLYHFYGACEWNSTRGATISRLYNDNLRQIVVVFPKSHHEQRRIAAQLDDLFQETQRLESLYQQKFAALDELKKSFLHQAFSGQL
ncbi:MAG: restriction endonuclease subunit S [Rugosibacter sp.]